MNNTITRQTWQIIVLLLFSLLTRLLPLGWPTLALNTYYLYNKRAKNVLTRYFSKKLYSKRTTGCLFGHRTMSSNYILLTENPLILNVLINLFTFLWTSNRNSKCSFYSRQDSIHKVHIVCLNKWQIRFSRAINDVTRLFED